MLHLLKIEWLKVRYYPTFWILLILIIISIPALNYVVYDFSDNAFPKNAKQMQQILLGRPFSFPMVWQTTSFLSSMILFIPALLIITLTTNEFTYKTHRQNIIDGMSRAQFIWVKLVQVLLLSLFCTLLQFGTAVWLGHLAAAPGEKFDQFANIHQLGYYFVEVISYVMLSFLLSILIKRAALVVGIFFLYSMIAEQIIVQVVHNRFGSDAGNFLPLQTCDKLLPNPIRILTKPEEVTAWNHLLPYYLLAAGIYFLFYCVFSLWYFRTKDL